MISTLLPVENHKTAVLPAPPAPVASAAPVSAVDGVARLKQWQRGCRVRLMVTDVTLIAVILSVAYLARWGPTSAALDAATEASFIAGLNYVTVSVLLGVGWVFALQVAGAYEPKILGGGSQEYSRVAAATVGLFGIATILAVMLGATPSRLFLGIASLAGFLLLPFGRWCWRQWLGRQRAEGNCVHRAVLVGSRDRCEHVANQIGVGGGSGYVIVGTVVDENTSDPVVPWVPVLPHRDPLIAANDANADTVILVGSTLYGPRELRELGWRMDDRGLSFVVAPSLTDIAGPRIHTRAVAGLPLIHVDRPNLSRPALFTKRMIDVVGSFFALVVLSPVFLVVMAAVKMTSPGPVFFHQRRVGINGRPFTMHKFRSMVVDAEARLDDLREQSDGNGVLFKIREDPRVTTVGAKLRKYSLDEMPQFLNVLRGEMSLVGPRPPLACEVEDYDTTAWRRMTVRPGITGLWQVSGRSDLDWQESIRLDLDYVENWSVMGDFVLLFRTVKAVCGSNGAY